LPSFYLNPFSMFSYFYQPIHFLRIFSLICTFSFLSYHHLAAQNNCGNAIAITSIPFSSGAKSTCGTVNDYAAGTYCNTSYGEGEDYVHSIAVTNAPVTYTFSLGGTATWKILSVHSTCPPTPASCIGNITTGNGTSGTANMAFITNGTYYIYVDTWPTPNCGDFTLNIAPVTISPVNNNCSGAISLPVNINGLCTNIAAGNTAGGSQSLTACVGIADDDIWYSFMATSTTHNIQIFNVSGETDMVHQVFSGSCNNLISVACSDPNTSTVTGLTIGTTYYIRVFTFFDGNGATFSICVTVPPPVPSNDVCANATPVAAGYSTILNVENATNDAAVAGCNGVNFANQGVWYVYTQATGSNTVTLLGCKSNYDMRVRVFSGTCGALACVKGDDDDDCSTPGSEAAETTTFNAAATFLKGNDGTATEAPVNYYILITGNGGLLNFSISVAPLPLELLSFTGKPEGTINKLMWETATEKNVQWHIIERSSEGATWSEVGRKAAINAPSGRSMKYEMEDQLPRPRTYYRLRSVDMDGTENISRSIIVVRKSDVFAINAAYPSPTNDLVTLQFNAVNEASVTIRFTDITGRIIYEQIWTAANGVNEVPVSMGAFPAGLYFTTIVDGPYSTPMIRIVKQ